ncbi:zinc finger protein 300-like [Cheilinus undulatus]|uniref:zinc finger protein 300-like n=1 Tax=Cheilinus undulatus TaxID=241271 RepID=UPI001BD52EC5|nr:zinc finger protein 300-like [Cheilinus undulatus]
MTAERFAVTPSLSVLHSVTHSGSKQSASNFFRTDGPVCSFLAGFDLLMNETTSRTMSSSESLREFITERLTAAAEDIFVVFRRTIVEYEEEIDRQRRLLDVAQKPLINPQRPDVPQQHDFKEEEGGQQLCHQERNSSLDQEEPEPPSIKEEEEEEQLVVTQEMNRFMLTHHSEGELQTQQQLLSNNSHMSEDPEPRGSEHQDSESAGESGPKQQKKCQKIRNHRFQTSENEYNHEQGQISLKCVTCGEDFNNLSELKAHLWVHFGKKMHLCGICGEVFGSRSQLSRHRKTHTAEKLYPCEVCGKDFSFISELKIHMRTHTGERPFSCSTCGNRFFQMSSLTAHKRIHTGERPFICQTCGRSFRNKSNLKVHERAHTGERPYSCSICGATFIHKHNLNKHTRIHTEEGRILSKHVYSDCSIHEPS